MSRIHGTCWVFSFFLTVHASSQNLSLKLEFSTVDFVLGMNVSFPEPWRGKPLAFYNSIQPSQPICFTSEGALAADCSQRFVGAAAMVVFSVRTPDGRVPEGFQLRERVTVTDQHPSLPVREPFACTITFVDGLGSDLQLFGYDEQGVSNHEREKHRREAEQLWRLFRQELYANHEQKPFAVLEWKHTIRSIRLIRSHPPAQTR